MTHINSNPFLETVIKTVAEYDMLNVGDSVLVGLSGGADSVALLLVLCALQKTYSLKLSCAHVNHQLRGESAERDRDFVKELCARLDVPLALWEEDVGAYAKEHHLSLEAAGREIRYQFFHSQNTDKIAVAHTKDDCAETVLMNLIKGNIPIGIPPKRENIIRPLLGVAKEEIFDFLSEYHQDFVTDESNFSKEYTRNRIRLDLIPYITENFNRNFTNTIYNTADILWQEQTYLEEVANEFLSQTVQKKGEQIVVSADSLCQLHPAIARKVLRQCYYQLAGDTGHLSYEHIHRLLQLCKSGQSGQKIQLCGGVDGLLSKGNLMFCRRREVGFYSIPLLLDEWTKMPHGGWICLSKESKGDCLCYPVLIQSGDTVTLRNRKKGDRLYYHNQNIHKKLSDFLSEKKISANERDVVPLVAVNDTVRIVVGHFFETVSNDAQNLHYILIKTSGKGN